jgi:hypothetical protein
MLFLYRRNIKWEILAAAVSEEISGQEKCTKQLVLSAAKNAKYHSSQQKASLFFARNAI